MAYQALFKRYETKYFLTSDQKQQLLQDMAPYMEPDSYGRTTIRNIYFDTDDYRIIRRSLEKPVYKEKLRIRSYRQADPGSPVFVELKKKYKSVVYKRRLSMPEQKAMDWVRDGVSCEPDTQIAREIDYFVSFYQGLHPKVFLSYEREAFYCTDGSDFRVTFDDNILCRQDRLSLEEPADGMPLLPKGIVLMELKSAGGMPLWMAHALAREHLYKTSFSKYGTAYERLIYPQLKGARIHA